MRRLLIAAIVIGTLAWPSAAMAHPLGNFTVNAYSGLNVSMNSITVHYALDLAEIPTFQLKKALGSGTDVSPIEAHFRDEIPPHVSLTADGNPVQLQLQSLSASFREGQAGLQTLRVDAELNGVLPSPNAALSFEDSNFADRVGWREIVITSEGGQGIASSTVPSNSISDELRNYPTDLLSSPPRVTSASARLRPGAVPNDSGATGQTGVGPSILRDRFATLIERSGSPVVLLVAVLLAVGAGALHALGPGHGKTVMAAYLVGADGKARQALIVGTAVSLMHTTSVVVLGLITLWASNVFAPETVYPWLTLASGVVVLGLGLWLLRSRMSARAAMAGAQGHAGHEHTHGHDHGHGHGLSHAQAHAAGLDHDHGTPPAGARLTSWRGLGAIAISGGLLPSPTALVVLLGAVALHRVAFGIVLVGAFSIGLAAALTGVGLIVLKTKDVFNRRSAGRFAQLIPLLSAGAIFVAGLFLTGQAVVNLH